MPVEQFPVGETDRLSLDAFEVADAEDRHAYQALEEVARYLYRRPLSLDDCRTRIEKSRRTPFLGSRGEALLFAVRRKGNRQVLGEVVLTLTDQRAAQFEIGWVLNPAFAGHGYAIEAAGAVADLAFPRLGVHRLFARLDVENVRSVRLCERLGFRREAHLIENDRHPDGTWGSEFIYAAVRRDLSKVNVVWQ